MKPDRKSSEPRPATPDPAAVSSPASDLPALLASLEAEEKALANRKAQLEAAFLDDSLGKMKALLQSLAARGHDLSKIAKSLGLHARPAASSDPTRKGTGPSSNSGWFQVFRSRAIQVYLKHHPDVLASLQSQNIPSSEYADHLPVDDLKAIDLEAQSKADAKCPKVATA